MGKGWSQRPPAPPTRRCQRGSCPPGVSHASAHGLNPSSPSKVHIVSSECSATIRCLRPARSISSHDASRKPWGANEPAGSMVSTTCATGGSLHAQPHAGHEKKRRPAGIGATTTAAPAPAHTEQSPTEYILAQGCRSIRCSARSTACRSPAAPAPGLWNDGSPRRSPRPSTRRRVPRLVRRLPPRARAELDLPAMPKRPSCTPAYRRVYSKYSHANQRPHPEAVARGS